MDKWIAVLLDHKDAPPAAVRTIDFDVPKGTQPAKATWGPWIKLGDHYLNAEQLKMLYKSSPTPVMLGGKVLNGAS